MSLKKDDLIVLEKPATKQEGRKAKFLASHICKELKRVTVLMQRTAMSNGLTVIMATERISAAFLRLLIDWLRSSADIKRFRDFNGRGMQDLPQKAYHQG